MSGAKASARRGEPCSRLRCQRRRGPQGSTHMWLAVTRTRTPNDPSRLMSAQVCFAGHHERRCASTTRQVATSTSTCPWTTAKRARCSCTTRLSSRRQWLAVAPTCLLLLLHPRGAMVAATVARHLPSAPRPWSPRRTWARTYGVPWACSSRWTPITTECSTRTSARGRSVRRLGLQLRLAELEDLFSVSSLTFSK
jgi:hypothetical protein